MLKQKKGSLVKLVLKILVSAGLFFIIFKKIDEQALLTNIKNIDGYFIPLIIIFLVLNYIVSSYRWKSLLIFDGSKNVSVSYLTSLYFVGSFFNNFAPTSIGGDVYKVYKLGKKINSTTHAFSATFMERFTGVLVLFLISIISMSKVLSFWVILILLWFILAIYLGIVVLKKLSHSIPLLGKIYKSLSEYKKSRRVVATAVLTSIIVQLLAIFTQYFVFLSLGYRMPLDYALLIFPLITLASFVIPSLNGIGVQDALYMFSFQFVAIPQEISLSASILHHLFRLFVSLIGGIIFLINKEA